MFSNHVSYITYICVCSGVMRFFFRKFHTANKTYLQIKLKNLGCNDFLIQARLTTLRYKEKLVLSLLEYSHMHKILDNIFSQIRFNSFFNITILLSICMCIWIFKREHFEFTSSLLQRLFTASSIQNFCAALLRVLLNPLICLYVCLSLLL